MTEALAPSVIKDRFERLKIWSEAYTARIEKTLQALAGTNRIHCFVMDGFEAAYPEEHVARNGKDVFILLRVALDLGHLSEADRIEAKRHAKNAASQMKRLRSGFHEKPAVFDLDWHISDAEVRADEGTTFAEDVCLDIERLCLVLNLKPQPNFGSQPG